MDVLQKLKLKNEEHRKAVSSDNKNIWFAFIHAIFVMVLMYYEIISKIEQSLDFAQVKVLIFIYIYYNFIIIGFCDEMFKRHLYRFLALVIFHSTFIFYWIYYKDQYGVAYMVGVLFVVFALKSFYTKVILREADES